MMIAIWIIAICSVIRITQNTIQLHSLLKDASARNNAYAEFVKSLKATDKDFVKRVLNEFEIQEEKEQE